MIQPLSFAAFKFPDASKKVKVDVMVLRGALTSLGEVIGRRPVHFLIGSVIFALLSIAGVVLLPKTLIMSIEEGFLSTHSEALRANQLQAATFSKGEGKPWYMGVFGEPRNTTQGNMLNHREYAEHVSFYKRIKSELIIMRNERGNFTFLDYCGKLCGLNDALFSTMGVYQNAGFLLGMQLKWPVTRVLSFDANIGKHFFKRTYDKSGEVIDSDLTALYFMQFPNSTEMSEALANFERLSYIEANRHNSNPHALTNLFVHSEVGVQGEIQRGMSMLKWYGITGFGFLFIFMVGAFAVDAYLHSRLGFRSLVLAVLAVLLIVPVAASTFALLALLAVPINLLMLLTVIVSMALIVDGTLHIFHSWLYTDQDKIYQGNDKQLGYVFETSIASVLITCLSFIPLALSFFLLSTPSMENVFFTLAVTAAFVVLYLLFLFAPIMILLVPSRTHDSIPRYQDSEESSFGGIANGKHRPEIGRNGKRKDNFWKWLSRLYAESVVLRLVSITVVCLALGFSVYWIKSSARADLDYRNLLTADSFSNKGVSIMSDVVWPDILHIIFYVESPPDMEDPEQYTQFMSFLNESSHLPHAMGRDADQNWINDYLSWTELPANAPALNMSKFYEFITNTPYSAWNTATQYEYKPNTNIPIFKRFVVMTAFNGTRSIAGKARAISSCRELAARYPQFDLVPFDTETTMVDILLQMPRFAFYFPLFLSLSILIVFFIFSPNVASAIMAAAGTLCLSYFIICASVLFGMDLNTFTTGFSIIFTCLCGRLAVHLTFHYHESGIYKQRDSHKDDQVEKTLTKAGLPTICSLILSVILVLPLCLSPVPLFVYPGLLAIAQILIGFVFCFILFPSLLATVPQALIGQGIIYTRD